MINTVRQYFILMLLSSLWTEHITNYCLFDPVPYVFTQQKSLHIINHLKVIICCIINHYKAFFVEQRNI